MWVTDGRMIENYLTGSLLSEAIAEAHPNAAKGVVWKQYGALTKLDGKRTFDKVAVARSIAGRPADFTMLDLNEKVNHLIECIRQHNSE